MTNKKVTELDEEVAAYKIETNERFDALEKKLDDGMGRLDAGMAAIKEELKQLILGRGTQSETMPETTKSATKVGPYIPPIPRFNDGLRRDYDDIGFALPNNTLESSNTMGKNHKMRSIGFGREFGAEPYERETHQNSEHRMRKLKMPIFEGDDAHGWIYRVERYFEVQGVIRRERLRAAALCLEGEALAWYRCTFIKGLKPEIRSGLRILQPTGLRDAMRLTQMIEDNQVSGRSNSGSWLAGKSLYNTGHAITKNVGDTSSRMSSTLLGSQNLSNNSRARNQFKKLTDSELHEKQKKGLCFRCDKKYRPGHRCLSPTLQVLLVGENDEESMEEDMEVEDVDHAHLEVIEVSLNSIMGFTSNHTMKLHGIIGDMVVVVLIDSGATHNFMSTRVVKQLGIMVMDSSRLTVTLSNGQVARSKGMCKGVIVSLPGMQLIEDFLPLELGSTDVILGIKWL
ncbi:putative mitochondrial protein [Tanacetum coccineum]